MSTLQTEFLMCVCMCVGGGEQKEKYTRQSMAWSWPWPASTMASLFISGLKRRLFTCWPSEALPGQSVSWSVRRWGFRRCYERVACGLSLLRLMLHTTGSDGTWGTCSLLRCRVCLDMFPKMFGLKNCHNITL